MYDFPGGQIPDANMIHAIRKQRQQAREQGDMIPLDDTVRWDESSLFGCFSQHTMWFTFLNVLSETFIVHENYDDSKVSSDMFWRVL